MGRKVIVEASSPQVVMIFHKPKLLIDEMMVYEI